MIEHPLAKVWVLLTSFVTFSMIEVREAAGLAFSTLYKVCLVLHPSISAVMYKIEKIRAGVSFVMM